jgi:hypothetical protein
VRWNSIQPIADSQPADDEPGAGLPLDGSRLAVMRRTAAMSLEERLSLFEALSRDAAWARAAVRVR